MNKKSIYIIISIFLFSSTVSFIDAFIHPNYFSKIPIKIVFFLLLPFMFFIINKNDFYELKNLFKFPKRGIIKSILLGILIYLIIVLSYFLTKNVINYTNVTTSLKNGMKITEHNFLYVAIYISFINSLLEEFFFRGYGFLTLKKYTATKFAYIFSSLIFAIYHIGMLFGMFNVPLLLLLLTGLFLIGCLLNYLNEINSNIYPSWITHIFTDLAFVPSDYYSSKYSNNIDKKILTSNQDFFNISLSYNFWVNHFSCGI